MSSPGRWLALALVLSGCGSSTYQLTDPSLAAAIATAAQADSDIQAPIANSPAERIGCAVQLLARDRKHSDVDYAWLVCAGPPDAGDVSEPIRVTTDGGRIASIETPSETDYAGSLNRLFPGWIRDQITHQRGIDAPRLFVEAQQAQERR